MTNKATKKSGLVLNVNKTKKKICEYYNNFMPDCNIGDKTKKPIKKPEKKPAKKSSKKSKSNKGKKTKANENTPLFRGGPTTYVFLTSVMEQLAVYILQNSCDDISINKETEMKSITRKRIINTLKGNNALDMMFHDAIKHYDSGVDYTSFSIVSNSDLGSMLEEYLDEDINITPQGAMFIKYIIAESLNKCIKLLSIIKQNSSKKSIIIQYVIDAVRIFIPDEKLFNEFRKNGLICAEKTHVVKHDSDSSDDDSSDSDESSEEEESSEDEDSKKKSKKKSKK